MVGDDRLAARLHLLDVGVHRAVQIAGVFNYLPAQGFALLFALIQLRIGLTHLRTGQPAAVDRDVQLQAQRALLDVAAVGRAERVGVGEAEGVVVAFLVFRHGVEGRQVAGLALLERLLGGADRVVAGEQIEVLPRRRVDPGFRIVGRRRQNRQRVDDALNRVVLTVGQGDQRLERIIDLTLGDDAVGSRGVVTGLRLQHVGLVRKADIEALVGLIELTFERRFFSLGRSQIVLAAQHVEVAFGALQDQVLLGGRELQRGLFVDVFGCLILEPAIGAEQRLREGRLVGMRAAVGDGRRLVDRGAHVSNFGATGQVRQQTGAGLRHHFFLRAILGAGRREVGVVVDRFLIDADQIGFGRQGCFRCPGHCVGRTGHGNSQ